MAPIAVADAKRGDDTPATTGHPMHEQKEQRGEIAEREIGADAEVDAAGNEAKRHAERDEAELGKQPHQRLANCRIRRTPGIVSRRNRASSPIIT